MAPPKCLLCDTDATELESARLRETWSEHEGVCWAWHTNATAYWMLCLPCHRAAWPADMRCQNGNSKPWSHVQLQLSDRKGPHRLLAGDFFTTTPPPELRGAMEEIGRSKKAKRAKTPTPHTPAPPTPAPPTPAPTTPAVEPSTAEPTAAMPTPGTLPTYAPAYDSLLRDAAAQSDAYQRERDAAKRAATFMGVYGVPFLPEVMQRSCLRGTRETPPPAMVDVGETVDALRLFPKRGPQGPWSYRQASTREHVEPIPLLKREERGPFHQLKDTCDSCAHCLSKPHECLRMYVLHPAEDTEVVHQGYLCGDCNAQLLYGQSLPLAPYVHSGEGEDMLHALACWRDGAARRVETLRRCGAPYTPKPR